MTSYVNSYVEKTHLLRPPLGDVRNQPIKRLMAALNVDMFSRDVKCAKSKRCGSSFLEVRCMDLGEDLVHP